MEETLVQLINRVSNLAPHVWEIAVRQAYVQGAISLMDAIFCIVGLMVSIRLYLWGFREGAKAKWDSEVNPLCILAVWVGVIATVLLPFILWYNVDYALGNLLNPEYAAIQILLKAAGVK